MSVPSTSRDSRLAKCVMELSGKDEADLLLWHDRLFRDIICEEALLEPDILDGGPILEKFLRFDDAFKRYHARVQALLRVVCGAEPQTLH